MDNLFIDLNEIGGASMYIIDDESYDILFDIYDNQKPDGYHDMMEEIWKKFDELYVKNHFQYIGLQYNSHDHLDEPITFKRILQVM